MPFVFSERLPLPSLKSYAFASVLLFSFSVIYLQGNAIPSFGGQLSLWSIMNGNNLFVWIFFNMLYCCMLLIGKLVQVIALGKLRENEKQDIQDFFWNFVFYKFVFIFGVYNAQTMSEIMCWITWFSLLGLLHQFGLLCKDRYDYLTSKPSIPRASHLKIVFVSVVTYLLSYGLVLLAVFYGLPEGLNIFGFMISECILLNLKCFRTILRYLRYFTDSGSSISSENSMQFEYYSELALEFGILGVDLIYHVHMLIWSNGFLSLASLVLYWNLRTMFQEMKQRYRRHVLRNKIVCAVKERFRLADAEDLAENKDHCVICWETITSGRVLPCGHILHHTCLCSWLLQDMSCPTCRMTLGSSLGIQGEPNDDRDNIAELLAQRRNQGNSFFHFNGARIASWLPTFSIEFFHYNGDEGISDQELEEMAERLYSTFPSVPREEIWRDLRRTRSVEETADNVISRNLLSSSNFESLEVESNEFSVDESSSSETEETDSTDVTYNQDVTEERQSFLAVDFAGDSEGRERSYSLRKRKFLADARRTFMERALEESGTENPESPLAQELTNAYVTQPASVGT